MNVINLSITPLNQINKSMIRQYGGKSANLGQLTLAAEVSVPQGIAIGKDGLAFFLSENGIDLNTLERVHNLGMAFLESAIAEASIWQNRIVETIEKAPFPRLIEELLIEQLSDFDLLNSDVAVRSSCIVEDSVTTSFAGQYVTKLYIRGREQIFEAIRACWVSQYNGKVLAYALARRGMPILSPSMGVLIQQMLSPNFAGVCFTEGPTPKTKHFTIVESVAGVGEKLVSGTETPCYFEIKSDGAINKFTPPPTYDYQRPSNNEIELIAKKSRQIADYFGAPQDVEWAIKDGNLFILQSRPITVTGSGRKATLINISSSEQQSKKGSENSLIILRDDLHEWLITQTDPIAFRGASFLLSSQTDNGFWRLEGHPEWDAVGTAMIIQLLIGGGIPATLQWTIPRGESEPKTLGIPAAARWLIQNVNSEGTWGSDLWDTCQVVRALYRYGIKTDDSVIHNAIDFISSEVESGLKGSYQKEWAGAGFFAVALELFFEMNCLQQSFGCLKLLLESQTSNGEFNAPLFQEDQSPVPSEWHTAQAVSALAKFRERKKVRSAINKAVDWILSRQSIDGYWGVVNSPYSHYNSFFTAYAVIALCDSQRDCVSAIAKACKWLRGQQTATGAFRDIASSLMTMEALQRVQGSLFNVKIPIPIFLRIQTTLVNNAVK